MEHPTVAAWQIPGYLTSMAGSIQLDGSDLQPLAEQYGTPLFVFSEKRLRHNVENVRAAFQNPHIPTDIFYASKANSNVAILQILKDAGAGIEVNSGGELAKAIMAGFRPERIIFNGAAKTRAELREAIAHGIFSINVDSAYELDHLLEIAQELGLKANVTLRVIPEVKTGSHGGLQTGTHETKFGISEDELPGCCRKALSHPDHIDLMGLHMHIGSQTPVAAKFGAGLRALLQKTAALYEETGHLVRFLNLGGGLPVPYIKPGQEYLKQEMASDASDPLGDVYGMLSASLSPQQVAEQTVGALGMDDFWESMGASERELRDSMGTMALILEPGRHIVGDTALLLTTVQNTKVRRGSGDTWLMLDAGFNTLPSSSAYNWYYHAVAVDRSERAGLKAYRLGGPLCDSGDEFRDSENLHRQPDHRMLPEGMGPGDLVAFLDTGAYTLEQMSQYNGQCRAAAVLVRQNGSAQLIRKRDTYDDLASHDVALLISP